MMYPTPPTPSQESTKNNEVISIAKEGEDPSEFKFHYVRNGTKHLKDKKQHIADRWHYKCNQHTKEGVQGKAKYKVTVPLANPNDKHVFFLKEEDCIHNHQPPTAPRKRGRMDIDQKERVADYIKMGVKPAKIHQELVTENPDKASSMSQLNNLSYRESMKDMPYGTYTQTHTHLYFPYCLLFFLNVTNINLLQVMQFVTSKRSTRISCKKSD
jgi:hypothetical protein